MLIFQFNTLCKPYLSLTLPLPLRSANDALNALGATHSEDATKLSEELQEMRDTITRLRDALDVKDSELLVRRWKRKLIMSDYWLCIDLT